MQNCFERCKITGGLAMPNFLYYYRANTGIAISMRFTANPHLNCSD